MPYPDAGTLANIFAVVRKEFDGIAGFREADVNNNWLFYKANADLDVIYRDCFPEPHQLTFTSAADTWEYPFDGTTTPPNIAKGLVNEIIRVDYDGSPLTRLLAVGDMILPTADTVSADPEYWFEQWKSGVRYLCFDAPCLTTETVRLWITRTPAVLTATTSVPALDKDFWSLLEAMLIQDVYRKLRMYKDCDYWKNEVILPLKTQLAKTQNKRLGKYANRLGVLGATDIMSNS